MSSGMSFGVAEIALDFAEQRTQQPTPAARAAVATGPAAQERGRLRRQADFIQEDRGGGRFHPLEHDRDLAARDAERRGRELGVVRAGRRHGVDRHSVIADEDFQRLTGVHGRLGRQEAAST